MKGAFVVFRSILALILALLCLFCPVSCAEKEEVISEEALEYFNKGLSAFNIADCKSSMRAYAILKDAQSGQTVNGYLLYTENFYKNEGHTGSRKSETYYGYSKTPDQLLPASLTHFSTSYRKDDQVYYEHLKEHKKYRVALSEDYSSAMGLYSLGSGVPQGTYGVKGGGTVRADLIFDSKTCEKLQAVLIYNMKSALLGSDAQMTCSPLTVSAHINEKDNRFTGYTLTFTGNTEISGKAYRLSFHYEEVFFDYDTKEEIAFPADLDTYEKLK
ncbi:MAG: hypothetical protein IJZ37_03710 [Clostridia bacterium]|nr:hypothetical protein [Clostridia bacterium]